MSQRATGNRGASLDSQRFRARYLTAVQDLGPGTNDTEYHCVLIGFGRSLLVGGFGAGTRASKRHILIMQSLMPPRSDRGQP